MYANTINSVFFAKEYRSSEFPTAEPRRRSQSGLVDRRPPGAGQRPQPRNRRPVTRPANHQVGRFAVVAATFLAVVGIVLAILVTADGNASAATLSRHPTVSVSAHPDLHAAKVRPVYHKVRPGDHNAHDADSRWLR